MITTITINEKATPTMYSTWEYAAANEDHAYHVCQVIRSLGYEVSLTQRPAHNVALDDIQF
jgi:hypothetical protein